MRVALFGGTFDPIHRGHLAIAAAAADRFRLDTVFFAPTGRQPLKQDPSVAGFSDRLAMAALACQCDARFAASEIDAPHPDGAPNFTVDTLAELANQQPGATIFNLVGADSFHDLARWREPERLLELAEWIVVSRPGHTLADPEGFPLTDAQRDRIHLLDEVQEHVSATALRQRLREGDACRELLPAPVAEFIQSRGLYR